MFIRQRKYKAGSVLPWSREYEDYCPLHTWSRAVGLEGAGAD